MSQKTAKFIPLSDKRGSVFWWGVIDNLESWKIPNKNSPFWRNFRIDWMWIKIRPWFYQYWDDLGATDYPRWIDAYYRSVLANDRIVLRYNTDWTHKLVTVVPSTWVQASITTAWLITSDNRMNFLNANDSLYCFNWVDLIGKLNWTTYSNETATLTPSFWAFYDNSAFVAWDSSNPTKIYKSATNDPEDFAWTWSDEFSSSYPVVWLASTAQAIYIFSENSVDMITQSSIKQVGSALVYTSIPLEANEWGANHQTIWVYGRDCYYLSKSNKLKKVAPGQSIHYDVKELSHRENNGISKIMGTLDPDQSDWNCYVIPEMKLIKWHLKTKWSSFNDVCIIYDTGNDEFLIDDHKVFYWGVNYKTQNFTISQIEPKVYIDEFWATDDDSAIQFTYTIKELNFWTPTILKCLWQMRLYLSINTIWKVYQNIYADWGLVDRKLIDSNTIPQAWGGLWTEEFWTYAIWTEWYVSPDTLYNTTIVRDKWYLRIKAKNFQVTYESSELWTQILLQSLEPQVEQLPFLTTSHY